MHRFLFLMCVAPVIGGCPVERHPEMLDCAYPGESYRQMFQVASTCWSEGDVTLEFAGTIPGVTPEPAEVGVHVGPPRSFEAIVRHVKGQGCVVALRDVATETVCDLTSPPLGEALSCEQRGAPATCIMYMDHPTYEVQ